MPQGLSGDIFLKANIRSPGPKVVGRIFRLPHRVFGHVKCQGASDCESSKPSRSEGIHLRTAFPLISRAPRRLTIGEGSLAAAYPQPLGSGGTDSALHSVTRRSSDALRLSSSGWTCRKSPLKGAIRNASSSSSCSISSASPQTLRASPNQKQTSNRNAVRRGRQVFDRVSNTFC